MTTIPNSTTDHGANRSLASMAYDKTNHKVVLFGGRKIDGSSFSDTWLDASGTWTKQSPATSPSARFAAACAFSSDDGYTFVFGGKDDSTVSFNAETWFWNGTTWAKFSALMPYSTAPSERFASAMVSCDGYNELLCFGGIGSTKINHQELLQETWKFNTSTKTWAQITSTNNPDVRAYHGMAFDGYNAYVYGGWGNGVFLNDLWKINALGLQWSKVSTTGTAPIARKGPAVCWDQHNSRLMVFGGYTFDGANGGLSNCTYVNTAGAWSKLSTPTHPTRRYNASMVFNPDTNTIILFGGTGLDGAPLGDVAIFDCVAQTWSVSGDVETAQTTGPVSDM